MSLETVPKVEWRMPNRKSSNYILYYYNYNYVLAPDKTIPNILGGNGSNSNVLMIIKHHDNTNCILKINLVI